MKIRVIEGKCQGNARCWSLAPDLYVLDDEGYILPGVIAVPEGQEALAARGVRACPERALEILTDD
jgi:ferredoxin